MIAAVMENASEDSVTVKIITLKKIVVKIFAPMIVAGTEVAKKIRVVNA